MILSLKPLHDWLDKRAERVMQRRKDKEQRRLAKGRWHFWFAWKPRVILIGNEVCIAWLSTIARKRNFGYKPKYYYGPVTNVITQKP